MVCIVICIQIRQYFTITVLVGAVDRPEFIDDHGRTSVDGLLAIGDLSLHHRAIDSEQFQHEFRARRKIGESVRNVSQTPIRAQG